MKQLSILSILFMFGMSAACSTTPSGTAQSDIKDTSTSPEVTAEAPPKKEPALLPGNQDSDNTYHNAEVGFSVTKPSNWSYRNPDLVKAHVNKVRLNDKDLEELVKKNRAPLVVITQYPLSTPTLNPNVVVNLIPVPVEGFPLKNVMNASLGMVKRSFPDLTLVDEIQNSKVDGIEGAYSKFKYTMSTTGHNSLIMARMWLIPRGKVIFSIIMTGPLEGPDVSEETFKEILSSIRITR